MIRSQFRRVVVSATGRHHSRVLHPQQHRPRKKEWSNSNMAALSFSSSAAALEDDDDAARTETPTNNRSTKAASRTSPVASDQVLVEFRQARLRYPSSSNHHHSEDATTTANSSTSLPIDLQITNPTLGGHALLGRNSSGKSLLGQTIVARGSDEYLKEGSLSLPSNWMSNAVAHVSFDSHQELLREGTTTTTYRAISGGGTLNKAAQFLIVRFGLYGLLQRDVDTLSTGEIRKTLLVKALSTRPKLLILDNAFDGLDVASREVLKELVQKTITGFTQDILVQGINSKATAHTQILMMTHRAEELVDELERVSWFDQQDDGRLVTEDRNGRSGKELLEAALGLEQGAMVSSFDWEDPSIPSTEIIASWWNTPDTTKDAAFSSYEPIVQAQNLSIQRGDDVTLLHDLNWTISRGQRWLVGGGNGAGKSTLSRLLARPDADSLEHHGLKINGHVGWVSTERHMEMAKSKETVQDVLTEHGTWSMESAWQVAGWLGVDHTMDRQFCHLSQGQQKLVLIAAALASKPKLLVLDEPCQGLDGISRQQVLALVERICRATDISLVYITHHLEELLPSVSHALHLKERRGVYNGPMDSYNPDALQQQHQV